MLTFQVCDCFLQFWSQGKWILFYIKKTMVNFFCHTHMQEFCVVQWCVLYMLSRTMMLLWMNPLRWRAGLRCGYSSVLVTRISHAFFQASYSWIWTGYTPEWWGATAYPRSTGIPCSCKEKYTQINILYGWISCTYTSILQSFINTYTQAIEY